MRKITINVVAKEESKTLAEQVIFTVTIPDALTDCQDAIQHAVTRTAELVSHDDVACEEIIEEMNG